MKSTVAALCVLAVASPASVLANHRVKRHFGGAHDHAKRGGLGSAIVLTTDTTKAAKADSNNATTTASAAPVQYSSVALWSPFNGQESACGTYNNDTQLIFGISQQFWNITYTSYAPNKTLCGVPVTVTNTDTGKTLSATVLENSGRLEYTLLSSTLFTDLGGVLEDGMFPITYSFPQGFNSADGVPPTGNATALAVNGTAPGLSANVSDSSVNLGGAASIDDSATAVPTTITSAASATQTSDDGASAASASSSKKHALGLLASQEAAASDAADAASSSKAAAAAAASSRAAAAEESAEAAAAAATSKAQAAAAAASSQARASAAAASSRAAEAASSSRAAAAAASSKAAAVRANAQNNNDDDDDDSDSSPVHTGGLGTFYFQNGVAGNCGTVASDGSSVIALPTAMYANGANCGRKIKITRVDNGATAIGTVRDSCPTCVNNNCLDMSTGLYDQLGTRNEGQFELKWQFIS